MNLPRDWKLGVLGDVITSVRGGFSVKCEDRPAAPSEMAVLKTGSVLNGRLDPSQNKFVPTSEHDRLRTPVRAGTIIFCRKNSEEAIGQTALVNRSEGRIFLSDLLWELTPAPTVNPSWLLCTVQSDRFRRMVRAQATGTQSTMKNISQEQLLRIQVPIPPHREQCRISEILRTWDEAIEKLEALRAAKLRRHRALTHSVVFGTRQLDRFRTMNEVTAHRWFTLPANWSNKPIGKLAREISERSGDEKQHEVLSCSKHDGLVRSLEYFKKQIFSTDLSGYKKIWHSDFGFPSNHVEEGSIGLQNLTDVGLVSPIYTVFRFFPEKVDADYAFAVLKTELYRHIFEVSTSASVDRRGSLRWSEFSKLPFPVPSLSEQKAIAGMLRTAQAELDGLNTEIETVTRQKRGLMQKLLTGEWRVEAEGM